MERPEIDLLSADLYGGAARRAYSWMREHEPVHYDAVNQLWGIATYDGVLQAERDTELFSSAGGTRPDTGPLPWMIDLDGTDHSKRRKLVSRGFTPARVRASAGRLEAICDELIDDVCEQGTCDLVGDLAAPLPIVVIGDMLGVPPNDRVQLLQWSDDLIGAIDGTPERIMAAADAFSSYQEYSARLVSERRTTPTDDLLSVLVHAEVDGERLADDDILFESLLLLVGGDESTRHVISGGMEALLRRPAAVDALRTDDERYPTAVEEMLRWVTPIKQMARTITRDDDFLGTRLSTGDKVVLLYESANFDPTHFDEPDEFDIGRTPNDHLAFGFGPHHCLGASLARLEIQTMVRRIAARLPDLALTSEADPPRFLGAISSLPVRFTPSPRVGG